MADPPSADLTTPLSADDTRTYQSLVSALRWVTMTTRGDYEADVGALGAVAHNPTVGNLRRANKVLRSIQLTPNVHIRYLSKPFKQPRIVAVFDAAYGNRWDGYSTGGTLVAVRETHPDEPNTRVDPTHWSSTKISKMVHSATDAEMAHSPHAIMWAKHIHALLAPMGDAQLTNSRPAVMTESDQMAAEVENALSNTITETRPGYCPPSVHSDCDNFTQICCSLKVAPKNKEMGRHVTAARDALIRKEIDALVWIAGEDNPADGLTRPGRKSNSQQKQLTRAAIQGRMWLPRHTSGGAFVRRKGRTPEKKKEDARRDIQ